MNKVKLSKMKDVNKSVMKNIKLNKNNLNKNKNTNVTCFIKSVNTVKVLNTYLPPATLLCSLRPEIYPLRP